MRRLVSLLGLTFLIGMSTPARSDERIPLSILYAGNPGTAREKQYTEFLQQHFRKVDRAAIVGFTDALAAGHDVVIFDWDGVYPRDASGKADEPVKGLRMPKGAKVAESYDRRTVVIELGTADRQHDQGLASTDEGIPGSRLRAGL